VPVSSTTNIVLGLPSPARSDRHVRGRDPGVPDRATDLNVATNGPSGHPHVVAMWFTLLDGNPAFWTFGRSQKVVNIRRDDKITGLVESGERYQRAQGRRDDGEARLIEGPGTDLRDRQGGGLKYTGPAALEATACRYRSPGVQATRGGDRRRTLGELGSHQTRGAY
jgi:hypothetical protein